MEQWHLDNWEGGRKRLPFAMTGHLERKRRRFWLTAAACLCLIALPFAHGQARFPRYGSGHAQHALQAGTLHGLRRKAPQPPRAVPQAPAALALLKRMFRPLAPYAGEQVTERNERMSRQWIRGDTRGRVRMDFLEPANLAGDVMLIAPNQYRYYHKRTNTLDIAFWPTQQDLSGQERRIANAIRQKRLAVMAVGNELVAGRNAAIIEIATPSGGLRGFESKLWIDPETGIKLKQEISGPRGLVSRSYFIRIAIGPAADVRPKDFEPPFLQTATPNILFPPNAQRYGSMQEARPQLSFAPLEPSVLPPGFHLSGVWVFSSGSKPRPERQAVLLRYTDGVTAFSLFERPARANARPLLGRIRRPAFRRSIQRWQIPLPTGASMDIIYIGHLAQEQVQAIHDSLR
ncbi:MAG TPA: sigma-E factor regulatory protein RseB domain-containing protein [Chthonomonadaceae bacterium]|nr:sigma-E factor regulatory protein RseB domain-containing protein [Chthonomonadaceae bacterium]